MNEHDEDGEMEIIQDERDGTWHETSYGQHLRWLRQAPDLFEKYQEVNRLYHELLWEVSTHYDGESRHETARRYLRAHDSRCRMGGPSAVRNDAS